ncbi:hypothetical protein HMI01_19440 [Halolactibacillus miurensis]|uniref:Uncharacterized protein n=1 Tax=Halolactibacillus miurensis TaxID=306541 RepID=A0A1I6S2N4_9BACI|nr:MULTISPECIES: hypothetical protein [Halolactibacillus]GEM04956.1 hypothetical protein HMI01_19440 [Halolactibacillus miurensis]SFS71166.1 hypothetical protein SAMN05421668_107100 [Halolactibacillus miurensis]
MGYVLPIDQYVYQAYHNRVIGQEVEPFKLDQLERVPSIEGKHHSGQSIDRHLFHQAKKDKAQVFDREKKSPLQKLQQDLTGKGQYIDAFI